MTSRRPAFDRFQQRHPALGVPIAVIYKYADDQGGYLAALITYYGFLSLFPLLLLAVTVLGFVLAGSPHVQQMLIGSALSHFPIIGKQIQSNVHAYQGSTAAVVVGIVAAAYGALGVAQAGQNAMNTIWAVPRNERPNPLKSRLRSFVSVLVLGLGILVTTALSGAVTAANSYATSVQLGWLARLVALLIALAGNIALFLLAFRLLTHRDLAWRDIAVGAVTAGVLWQALQAAGTYYLAHQLKGATEIYGLFGLVLGLLGWIYLGAVIVVFCAELNVVLRRRLWPRALLTPFTDDVDLTSADERAYTSYAKAQRNKGFEQVDVSFHPPEE